MGLAGRISALLAVPLVALLALVAWGSPAAAQDDRSYRIAEVVIAAELRADGSLAVTEQRTFAYDGTYRGAFYDLPLEDDQRVEQFSLRDETGVAYREGAGEQQPGTYVDTSDGDLSVTWYYATPATDEQRTFTLSYVVTNAGRRHADSAELYWQWIGTGWDVPTDRLVAEVTLPPSAAPLVAGDNLLIWAHGPTTPGSSGGAPGAGAAQPGTVEQVGPDTVRTAVDGVPASTFVELRALLPADALAAAPSDGREVRAAVLAEEGCLARGGSGRDCRPGAGRWRAAAAGALAALAVTWGATLWWKVRVTRSAAGAPLVEAVPPVAPPAGGTVWHDGPHPPALVAWLLAGNRARPNGIVATILELAQTERLALLPAGPDTTGLVIRDLAPAPDAFGIEVQRLLGMAAEGAPELSEAELRAWIDAHPRQTAAWWRRWKGLLDDAGRANGWKADPRWRIATRILAVPLLLVSWPLALIVGAPGIAGVLLAIAMLVASFVVGRRSREAATLTARWRAFGDYLQQTSGVTGQAGADPGAAARGGGAWGTAAPLLRGGGGAGGTVDPMPRSGGGAGGTVDPLQWGRWLPYATALGIAGVVARNLEARLAPAELALVGGVHGHGPGLLYPSLWHLHAVEGLPVDRIQAAASASSSGGGGGFSGGGGGGGGGSGGGAF